MAASWDTPTHTVATTAVSLLRSNLTKAKRLEELRLNDTTYYDHYDMHLYDGNDMLYDHIMLSILFIVGVDEIASSVVLGLCYDYSLHPSVFPRFPSVCIARHPAF
jgi:hypothetical protein